jgi:hypothetical protein
MYTPTLNPPPLKGEGNIKKAENNNGEAKQPYMSTDFVRVPYVIVVISKSFYKTKTAARAG